MKAAIKFCLCVIFGFISAFFGLVFFVTGQVVAPALCFVWAFVMFAVAREYWNEIPD